MSTLSSYPDRITFYWLAATSALVLAPLVPRVPPVLWLLILGLFAWRYAMLARACTAKKTSLKAALSDQRVVAGLGNIYVCEALYRARLSPKRQASTIAARNGKPNARAVALVDAIKAVLNDAIKAGGSSLRDHRRADGSLGDFQHNFQVYDREDAPCPSCKGKNKTKIKRIVQIGRSTFYCPSCQK